LVKHETSKTLSEGKTSSKEWEVSIRVMGKETLFPTTILFLPTYCSEESRDIEFGVIWV